MRVVLILIVLLVLVIILVAVTAAIVMALSRRGARRASERFGDAEQIVDRWGGDARPTRRLERLAADRRTPSSARTHLDRLIHYREHPIVLAPDWVPVVGWFSEVRIEAYLLRQAWKSLPPEVWAEYFPSTRPTPASGPAAPAATPKTPEKFADQLTALDRAGRYPELLRLLDRRMPPWPVGASLIEVAREIVELERNVTTARTSAVPEAVTSRLAAESRTAADALWSLADRVVTASAYGIESDRLTDHLERENAKLVELRGAIREARTGLAELTLTGSGSGSGGGDVDRAERRFRALARTAEELQEFDRI